MLVLSRRRGERIMIGSNIELTVVEIRGDRVRLGFCAPPEVTVHREEVLRRIESERQAASCSFTGVSGCEAAPALAEG